MKAAALAVLAVLAACSDDGGSMPPGPDAPAHGDRTAGMTCDTSAQCTTGLQCLDFAMVNGSSCTTIGKMCTVACTDNTACAPLGASFMCFATCTADKACGPTGP